MAATGSKLKCFFLRKHGYPTPPTGGLSIYVIPFFWNLIGVGGLAVISSMNSIAGQAFARFFPILVWTFLYFNLASHLFLYPFVRSLARLLESDKKSLGSGFYQWLILAGGSGAAGLLTLFAGLGLPLLYIVLSCLLFVSLLSLSFFLQVLILWKRWQLVTPMFAWSLLPSLLTLVLLPYQEWAMLVFVILLSVSPLAYGLWTVRKDLVGRKHGINLWRDGNLWRTGFYLGLAFALPYLGAWFSDRGVVLEHGLRLAPSFDSLAFLAYFPSLFSPLYLHMRLEKGLGATISSYFRALNRGENLRQMEQRRVGLTRMLTQELNKILWGQTMAIFVCALLLISIWPSWDGLLLMGAYGAWALAAVYRILLFYLGDDRGAGNATRVYGLGSLGMIFLAICLNSSLLATAFALSTLGYALCLRCRLHDYVEDLAYFTLSKP